MAVLDDRRGARRLSSLVFGLGQMVRRQDTQCISGFGFLQGQCWDGGG